MNATITAVVEGGLLRPTTDLKLAEGTRVQLIILGNGENAKEIRPAAAILAGIAALPTAGGDPRTSENHDQVLYGDQGAE